MVVVLSCYSTRYMSGASLWHVLTFKVLLGAAQHSGPETLYAVVVVDVVGVLVYYYNESTYKPIFSRGGGGGLSHLCPPKSLTVPKRNCSSNAELKQTEAIYCTL